MLRIAAERLHERGISDGGAWVLVRPSGTEPKIKFYYFARSGMRRSTWSLQETKENTVAKVNEVADDLSRWIKQIIAGT